MSNNHPEEARDWPAPDSDPERAVAELREGIERARAQLRTFRDALTHDHQDEAS